jgi:hypothetical protein
LQTGKESDLQDNKRKGMMFNMEFFILFVVVMIIYFIVKYVFDANTKKLKDVAQDKEFDKIVEKYPENIDICKSYLKMLNNEDVKIEEHPDSNTTMYFVMGDKISIANLKNSYTRVQTLAHECLHSVQSKKLLWFNFIFSNIFNLYFFIICILEFFNILPNSMMFLEILTIFGLVQYSVRMFLENDAMIKARFLAKEYMEEQKISSKEEINKIVDKYDELNEVGIKCVNFQILSLIIFKIIVFGLIMVLR